MATVTIRFDEERLTIGDLLSLEEQESFRSQVEVLAKFVVNGDGDYLDNDDGFEALKGMSIADLNRAAEEFKQAAQETDSPK